MMARFPLCKLKYNILSTPVSLAAYRLRQVCKRLFLEDSRMSQPLFRVKMNHEEPTGGTRDLRLVGHCSSGVKYAIKRESDGRLLPLAEWVGHKLSELCGIQTPAYEVVECLDGEVAFGSRWENEVQQLISYDATAKALLSDHAADVSRIFGLDFFLPNPDRHLGNFLFSKTAMPKRCLSFDFSLSSVRNGLPFGANVMGPSTKTSAILKRLLIDDLNVFDKHRYNEALAKVKAVDQEKMRQVLDSAPPEWYTAVSKMQILEWWDTSKNVRIAQVTK